MFSSSGTRAVPRLVGQLTTIQTTKATTITASGAASNVRTYISRAHPRPPPVYAVPEAIELVKEQVEKRKQIKAKRWKRNQKQREKKGIADGGGPYRPGDETVELAINLNVDPRKPGQSLRGSLSLPHGTGRKVHCVVFTEDKDLAQTAKEMGALHVGGESLIDQIANGEIPVESFQRSLATQDVMGPLSKKLARILGPRGLMPNPKVGTVAQPDQLLELLKEQLAGKEIQYRTEKEGILHVPVGRGSFELDQLLENTAAVMNKVYEVKPESFGKGKKKGGGGKSSGKSDTYILTAHLSSTFGKGFKVDLRTLDPSSAFFMGKAEI